MSIRFSETLKGQHESIYVPVVRDPLHTCGEPYLACNTDTFNMSHVEGMNISRVDGTRLKKDKARKAAAQEDDSITAAAGSSTESIERGGSWASRQKKDMDSGISQYSL